jgi:sialate O-acetylesterase
MNFSSYTFAMLPLILGTGLPTALHAQLSVHRLIGDGMVLQRNVAVPVWGEAAPGDEVVVTFAGEAFKAAADGAGRWKVTLPARVAGGPYDMAVVAKAERITVSDILVGDVWIASGQSNMEWTVADSKDAEQEIRTATDSRIRHFKVPRSWSESPEGTLAGGAWEKADSARVGGFTAVGYFFARELRSDHDVPIGLINTSWGGSRLEPWMSVSALGLADGEFEQTLEREKMREQALLMALRARMGELPEAGSVFAAGIAYWADPALDETTWSELVTPGVWEEAGYQGLDGIAWYRTTFQLSPDEVRSGVRLGLGMIDDSDIVWVNGQEIGRTEWAWNRARMYDVPASILQPGRNVIAIRVEDGGGGGGIHGDPALLFIETSGAKRSLAGTWKFKVEAVSVDQEGRKNQVPTLLFNKMIHPLLRYPIKGVLWYQGESNANPADAFEYRNLFARMIEDWRGSWRVGDFPFLFVQLANYGPTEVEPAESSWAMLRESQSAVLSLPQTGQAVTIDIGEADDIHPRNKQEVGRRLALAARNVAYGEELVYSGPVYRRHHVRDGRVLLEFDHVADGVAAGDGESRLQGFAVAGPDRRFVWAEAAIEGDGVVVWSERVPNPVAVRYAWGDNPQANLYNGAGLPATPFRTDAW